MSVRSISRFGAIVVTLLLAGTLSSATAQEKAKEQATPAASTPPAAVEKATLTKVACAGTKLSVAWKGSGVGILDYLSAGEPRLQERKDPAPTDTSMEIPLGDQWKGRSVDVRIWDKDAKLLDSKSTECKAAS
jgi:hypothetical protein